MEEPRFISYERSTEILTLLESLLDKPKRARMQSYLLVGDSNNGKTTIIQEFCNEHQQATIDSEMNVSKPVILVESPPTADEKRLYCAILDSFFTQFNPTAPAVKLQYQVLKQMRECHVRLLIIDEFHSLLAGTFKKQCEVMNTLKMLCNELGIPIVGVGTQEAKRALQTDPQTKSRFQVIELPKWDYSREFRQVLSDFESFLPLRKPSRLQAPDTAKLLLGLSRGNLGDLHRLLVACAREAILSGKEYIDAELIYANEWVCGEHGTRDELL